MKRLLTFAIMLFLGAGLVFAQENKPRELNPQPLPPGRVAPAASAKGLSKNGKKGPKKGGKERKKNSGGTTTPAPK